MLACLFALVLIFSFAESTEQTLYGLNAEQVQKEGPWFTGTLLAPVTSVLKPNEFDIEPFFFALDRFGKYNSHWHAKSIPSFATVPPLLFMQIGLFPRVDFKTFLQVFYNSTQGKSSVNFGDLPVGLDFLITSQHEDSTWLTTILSITEFFPTGRYQKLNPRKRFADVSGAGVFATQISLAVLRLFHIGASQYLNTYLTLQDTISSSTHVKGFNAYGGGFGTHGKVHPGNLITAILSMEYSITKNWVLALDIQNLYGNKIHFTGTQGLDVHGVKIQVGRP